jgi:hypothetical protein
MVHASLSSLHAVVCIGVRYSQDACEMSRSLAAKKKCTVSLHSCSSAHESAQRRVRLRLRSGRSLDGHPRAAKGRIRGGSCLTLASWNSRSTVRPADFRAAHSLTQHGLQSTSISLANSTRARCYWLCSILLPGRSWTK